MPLRPSHGPLAVLTLLACGAIGAVTAVRAATEPLQPPPPISAPLPSASATAVPAAAAPAGAAPAPGAPAAVAPATTAAITTNREIVLELGKRSISLLEDGKVLGRWPVAIGDPATPTPTGRFQVRNKVVNPQYQSTKSGRNNPVTGANGPLGDRWIGFHTKGKDQFGIHGTPNAWAWAVEQRAAVTHGCVRMLGPHVRQLFSQVEVGTPVTVLP